MKALALDLCMVLGGPLAATQPVDMVLRLVMPQDPTFLHAEFVLDRMVARIVARIVARRVARIVARSMLLLVQEGTISVLIRGPRAGPLRSTISLVSSGLARILDFSFDGGTVNVTTWHSNWSPGLILGALCTIFPAGPV